MSQFHFKFIYQESGVKNDSLTLLKFSGQETISSLFNFELELKSSDINLDGDSILNQACSIEIYYGDQAKPIRIIHGLINEFEDINYLPDSTLYRANVVPRIWQLGLFETNEVYLNESIQDTLTVILEEADFIQGQDFRFELARTYRKWPFRLQYNETHLAYLQRIIEREGIYYYFEQSDSGEVLVFCDNNQALPSISQAQSTTRVVFQPSSGLNVVSQANTINSIICKRQTLPKKVTLRDFNDETPSLDIRGTHVINSTGMGEINLYGLNITSPEEGQQLAEIHANAYLSRQKSYICQGDVATMTMGHTFTLSDHPRDNFNQLTYLLESIHHEGTNVNEYKEQQLQDNAIVNYSNTLTALSTEHEFAPKRQTLAPEINGTLNAVVDAEADSGYAELDEFGRYKIKLPFDRKDRDGGKASHWVRMMQPYGGANEGMHFPLRNGTRVLLGFIGGDPDRPFISGTINDNGEQQSIVTAENQSNNLIKTASGNKIELEDKEGKNRIKLQTGDNKTYMHLGSPNHPGDGFVVMSSGIERKEVTGGKQITRVTTNFATAAYLNNHNTLGSFHNSFDEVTSSVESEDLLDEINYFQFPIKSSTGNGADATQDTFTAKNGTGINDITHYKNTTLADGITVEPRPMMNRAVELSGYYLIERTLGDKYTFEQGNEYEFNSPGDKRFQFGADREIIICQDDVILDNSYVRTPASITANQTINRQLQGADVLYGSLVTLLTSTLKGYQSFASNTDLQKEDGTGPKPDWEQGYWRAETNCEAETLTDAQANDLLDNKCNFRVARHNTFNIQKGNIFDFGGYWNYNLGNSYVENHGNQSCTINKKDPAPIGRDAVDVAGPQWTKISGNKVEIIKIDGIEAVEKSYAESYDYTQCEKSIDITVVAESESQMWGDTYDYHTGNSYGYHTGNSHDEHTGNSYEEVQGNSESVFGKPGGGNYSVDRYYGWKDEMMIAGSSEMQLGGASSLFLGAKNDISLAISNNVNMGLWTDISLGGKFTLDGAVELNARVVKTEAVAAAKLKTALSDISMIMNDINTITNDISTHAVAIESCLMSIESGGMKMFL